MRLARDKNDVPYEQLLEEERLILAATELVQELLDSEGVSRTQLADRLGTTKGNVSQLLAGDRNLTLRTFAQLVFHLGHRVQIRHQVLTDAPHGEVDATSRYEPPAKAWSSPGMLPDSCFGLHRGRRCKTSNHVEYRHAQLARAASPAKVA